MESVKPNKTRAKTAVAVLWSIIFIKSLLLVSALYQRLIMKMADEGEYISIMALSVNNSIRAILTIVLIIVSIVSIVTFIKWFRRAYFNLHQISNKLSYSEGWAAGGWFIPVINLYTPFEIMRDLFKESKNQLIKQGKEIKFIYKHVVVGWWWALVIINFTFTQFTFFYFDTTAEPLFNNREINALIADNILSIALAGFTIYLIRKYSKAESLLFEFKGS